MIHAKLNVFKVWEDKKIEPTLPLRYHRNTIIYSDKVIQNIFLYRHPEGTWALKCLRHSLQRQPFEHSRHSDIRALQVRDTRRVLKTFRYSDIWAFKHSKWTWALRHSRYSGTSVLEAPYLLGSYTQYFPKKRFSETKKIHDMIKSSHWRSFI